MNKPSAIHTSSPSVPVFWRVLEAAYELEKRLETALEGVGLSIAKAGLLKCLAQSDEPLALSDLASNTQCVRSNITQLMDRLEADGLVERVLDPDDRRIRRARLTAAGLKAYNQATEIVTAHERETAKVLGVDDAKELTQTLRRLIS